MTRYPSCALALIAAAVLAGCAMELGGEEDEWMEEEWTDDEFLDEEGFGDQGDLELLHSINCTPRGDAHGNGPEGRAVVRAIREAWGNNCRESQALQVARCESGHYGNCCATGGGTRAHHHTSSQYKGLFQMGSWERRTYGFNWCGKKQAKGAHRYFVEAGWDPWVCQPSHGC